MPTDDLQLEGTSTPNESETPPGDADTPPVAPPLTLDQVNEALNSQSGEQNKEVLTALGAIQGLLEKQANPETPPVEANELAEALLTDPKGTLATEFMAWAQQHLAAPMTRGYEIDRDERIQVRAREIDEEFGAGFFDENVRAQIVGEKGSLKTHPINQQADPDIIDKAINDTLGAKFRDPEQRAKMNDALTTTRKEREVRQPPNLMGPGRSQPGREAKITPEMRETLEGFQRVGVKMDEKDLRTAMSRGHSVDEWRREAT